jgi:site-specific DNA-cytosine methylase
MTTAPTSATPATAATVGSVCSGAGGLDLGLRRAGLRTIWFCEIDPWRRKVLNRHWPGVPVHHDLTALDPAELPRPTLLAGGTPCQNLSVAGGRAGLDGEQSRLFWDFIRIRNALEPEWALWENVAGSLSSNDGLDFAQVLAAFVGADVPVPTGGWPGAGVATGPWGGAVWRVLDAQYFRVPQRRRRVFVAGRLGGPCEPAILLDRAGGAGNPPARRGERPRVAAALTRGSAGPGVSDPGRRREDDVNLVVGTLPSRGRTGGFDVDPSMAADGHLVVVGDGVSPHTGSDQRGRRSGPRTQDGRERDRDPSDGAATHADGVPAPDELAGLVVPRRVANTLKASGRDGARTKDVEATYDVETSNALTAHPSGQRNDPTEQTFIVGDGSAAGEADRCAYDPQPDGRRYAACGDGVVANVTEWIGRRLLAVIDGTDPDHVPVPQPVARGGPDAVSLAENQRGEIVEAPVVPSLKGGVRVACVHPDAIGRDGVNKTAGPDAEGRVRRRDAGLGIQDDLAYTLGTGAPPAIIPYRGE